MGQFQLFIIHHWVLWLALVLVILAIAFLEIRTNAGKDKQVSAQEAVHLINRQHAQVVDVRSVEEYKSGHIIRAISLPLTDIEANMDQLKKYKTKPIIVVCASGVRAQKAAALLRDKEFAQVVVLAGGLSAWKQGNYPVEVS